MHIALYIELYSGARMRAGVRVIMRMDTRGCPQSMLIPDGLFKICLNQVSSVVSCALIVSSIFLPLPTWLASDLMLDSAHTSAYQFLTSEPSYWLFYFATHLLLTSAISVTSLLSLIWNHSITECLLKLYPVSVPAFSVSSCHKLIVSLWQELAVQLEFLFNPGWFILQCCCFWPDVLLDLHHQPKVLLLTSTSMCIPLISWHCFTSGEAWARNTREAILITTLSSIRYIDK